MIEPLGPEARALLDAAREGMSPDAAAVRRMRAKISVAVAAPAAGTAIGVKLGVVAFVAAAVGAGLYVTRGAPAALAPQVELASPSEVPLRAAVHEPAAPALTDDDLIIIEPSPRVAPPRPGSSTDPSITPSIEMSREVPAAPPRSEPARASEREVPARPRGMSLAREVELLDVAMAALRRGDPTAALRAVKQHAAETAGHGQLAEDAAAIEIEALCHLHDPTTNAKLEAFDARFPRSAQRSRLDNKCR